jgi:hypothetical protein
MGVLNEKRCNIYYIKMGKKLFIGHFFVLVDKQEGQNFVECIVIRGIIQLVHRQEKVVQCQKKVP